MTTPRNTPTGRDAIAATMYFNGEPTGRTETLYITPGSVLSLANSIRRRLPTDQGHGYRLSMAQDVADRLGVYETHDGGLVIHHPYLTTTGIRIASVAALSGARGGAAGKGKAKRRATSFDGATAAQAGAAGTGSAKRRDPEHYREMARRSAEARRKP